MKPEAQRIAIARACGWYRLVIEEDDDLPGRYGMAIDQLVPPSGSVCIPIPDYLNDLNAMNEAEKVLTDEQYHSALFLHQDDDPSYHHCLRRVTYDAAPTGAEIRLESASAAQRAEAFLKCLGLWVP